MRKFALILLVIAAGLSAQTLTIRGQFFLPSGDMPSEPIRFSVTSGDGRINDIKFSDSNGRFSIERIPSGRVDVTIFVASDESTYGDTRYNFIPYPTSVGGSEVRITLNRLPRKAVAAAGTLSVGSAYKPLPDAEREYQAALKDIEKQRLMSAEERLRKAIALDPRFSLAMSDLGAVLMNLRRYLEAEQVLQEALKQDPKFVLALLNMGIALNRQQKFDRAVSYLQEALRLQPGLVAAHLHLGIALVESDQLALAERELLRAARTEGEERVAGHLYLGKLYARTGEFNKGITALETYLTMAPQAANADEVRQLIAKMRQAMVAQR